jgi:hypothetical protein
VSTEFIDHQGKTLAFEEDLAKGPGAFVEPEKDGTLQLWPYFNVDSDLVGKKFTYKTKIWDKLGDAEINCEFTVFVK